MATMCETGKTEDGDWTFDKTEGAYDRSVRTKHERRDDCFRGPSSGFDVFPLGAYLRTIRGH